MPELEIELIHGGELDFDKFYLQFNAEKRIHVKSFYRFEFKC